MRQVDRAEFTYSIFAALRHWKPTHRREVFAPISKRKQTDIYSAAQVVADKLKLGGVEILSTSTTEALTRDQLAAVIESAIDAFPGAVGKLWMSGQSKREHEARATAANLIADALDPYQVLTHTPNGEVLFFGELPRHAHALEPTWP